MVQTALPQSVSIEPQNSSIATQPQQVARQKLIVSKLYTYALLLVHIYHLASVNPTYLLQSAPRSWEVVPKLCAGKLDTSISAELKREW